MTKERVIEELKDLRFRLEEDREVDVDWAAIVLYLAVEMLKRQALLQEPHKSGKWIDKDLWKEEYVLTGKCSVCGQVRVKDKFCSNCGARMVEPQESEDK